MATSLQSPGIQIVEKSVSLAVPGASTTVGGFAGAFQWGPVMQPILLSSENDLVDIFGKPDDNTAKFFFAAANFLSYTNALYVVRAATTNLNATAGGTGVLIKNIDDYEAAFASGQSASGTFGARYPGTLGNSLKVSIADAGTYSTWAFKDEFNGAPSTSAFAAAKGASNDELHIIVIDENGLFTGVPNTILEKFAFVSKASDAVSYQGTNNYYADVLANRSQYIYWLDHDPDGTNWGTSSLGGTAYVSLADTVGGAYDFDYSLSGGTDDNAPTDGELQLAYDILVDDQQFDISLFVTGNASSALAGYVVTNIAEVRRDCVAFVSVAETDGSPLFSSSSTVLTDAVAFRTAVGSSTYAVLDSGHKYQYDKYNDRYRWIALNADVAGLCARTDSIQDPWMSPAGASKGQIKGAIKLAFNPNRAQRDVLYRNSINPVVSFVGEGTILYGDKTLTNRPDAFDRINVRRLFLVLEKSIARSAKSQLFEINDDITRTQFRSAVEPFLRDVQGRRGIEAFKVICDSTNNTGAVVAANEFRGTILIKPRYSINFITLTFTAVGPDVSFEVAAGA